MRLGSQADRHMAGAGFPAPLVAIWCPAGAFRWDKHIFEGGGSPEAKRGKVRTSCQVVPPPLPRLSLLQPLRHTDAVALLFVRCGYKECIAVAGGEPVGAEQPLP